MRTRVLLAAALVACVAPRPRPPRGEQVLVVEGRVKNAPFRYGADDLSSLPRRAFEAAPPFTTSAVRFEGIAIAALLSDAMALRSDADLVVFRGAQGYAAPVPLTLVRYLRPVLADRAGGEPVASWLPSARPLQLAWPDRAYPGIDSDPRLRWWWVGGVTRVELQNWATTYGRALRVPAGATDPARLGAQAIATGCIVCHSVRGVGGTRGPPLVAALARDRSAFARKLRDHARDVSGIASAPELPAGRAGGIADFLHAVEVAGTPPAPDDELLPIPGEPPTIALPPLGVTRR